MPDRVEKPSILRMLLVAVLALVVMPSSARASVGVPQSRHHSKLSLSGSFVQDTTVKIKINDQPPAHPSAPPPFVIMIKVNEWTTVAEPATWNEESQSWEVDWQIPPGIEGSNVVVTALFTGGATASKSFTVR